MYLDFEACQFRPDFEVSFFVRLDEQEGRLKMLARCAGCK